MRIVILIFLLLSGVISFAAEPLPVNGPYGHGLGVVVEIGKVKYLALPAHVLFLCGADEIFSVKSAEVSDIRDLALLKLPLNNPDPVQWRLKWVAEIPGDDRIFKLESPPEFSIKSNKVIPYGDSGYPVVNRRGIRGLFIGVNFSEASKIGYYAVNMENLCPKEFSPIQLSEVAQAAKIYYRLNK